MASTTFNNGTVIQADWLQDVNDFVYNQSGFTKTVEDYGVVGGGVVDDTTTIQAALNQALADGVQELHFTNPDGYKITGQIVQPYGLRVVGYNIPIYASTVPTGRAVWVCEFSSWSNNGNRWRIRTPLVGFIFMGHASPADNVWTSGLNGIELRSYHQTLHNVTVTGFDKAFVFAQSQTPITQWLAWVITFKDCIASYCQYGLYADFSTASGGAGAAINWVGGGILHCDYSIYNYGGEITFLAAFSDAPTKGHVKDNITSVGGSEYGFLHFQNARIEVGGQTGTPWVLNSGTMRITDSFVTERNGTEYLFKNNGILYFVGGISRSNDFRYKVDPTSTGTTIQKCIKSVNNFSTVILNRGNSNIFNNDLNTGTTDGFAVISGAAALTNVSDTDFLMSGKALNIVNTAVNSVVSSAAIELPGDARGFKLSLKGKNTNATAIPVRARQYNRAGFLLTTDSQNIPAGGAVSQLLIQAQVQPGACYIIVDINIGSTETSQIRVSDFYMEWA